MANHVSAFIYGQNGHSYGRDGGIVISFTVANSIFLPISPVIQLEGASMNSKIKVLGTNNTYSTCVEFYTDKMVTDLNTEANSP